MTSASELFHNRRHRLGRNDLDPSFHSSPSPDFHNHRFHDSDDDDSLRIRRHYNVRRVRHPERVSDRFDARYRRSLFHDNFDSGESVRGIPSSSGGNRLPVGVRLARERLLQRLRGEPVDRNRVGFLRQNNRDLIDEEDQESELSSEVATVDSLVTDLTSQMARFQLLHQTSTKPPGLTQEALDCLRLEVFSSSNMESESRIPQDCGICLESYTDGDKLIHLQCGHKFHSACLDPWIRSCGDCPYCRRCIVVSSRFPKNEAV
ncbi:probable E3 ubiquitin-protein ligase RHY1A [Vicia villosa]|uniref:probable E3 ubiquitin-protein ligase RHY1A n=1 Tax=Vicia villosa TaxID=3911 RepID=UPI00273A8940|nr:probable E3 ubiquitin-protein ligase RHY1A [Vicia villosa]